MYWWELPPAQMARRSPLLSPSPRDPQAQRKTVSWSPSAPRSRTDFWPVRWPPSPEWESADTTAHLLWPRCPASRNLLISRVCPGLRPAAEEPRHPRRQRFRLWRHMDFLLGNSWRLRGLASQVTTEHFKLPLCRMPRISRSSPPPAALHHLAEAPQRRLETFLQAFTRRASFFRRARDI